LKRIVVTGLGLVTPLGVDCDQSFSNLLAGEDGHRPVGLFSTEGYITDHGGEIPVVPEPDLPRKHLRRMTRVDRLGLVSAEQAVAQSGISDAGLAPHRVAVVMGAGAAGLLEACEFFHAREQGVRKPLRHHFGEIQSSTSRWVAFRFGFEGPRACPSTACSSSLTAIGLGMRWIRSGEVDAAVVGGAESLSSLTWSGFNAVSALGPEPCSPFARHRRGMSLGEGGAALVLEDREHALARGAAVLAEVLSFATSADAHHMTAPHPEGRGAAQVMRSCLDQAGLTPGQIGLVGAHGTATPANDKAECAALREVFGDAANGLPVVSHKSAVGHCLGAAGAVETAFEVMALMTDTIPPNLRISEVDPDCAPFDFPAAARPDAGLEYVLKESFGFGGSNAALILGRGDRS